MREHDDAALEALVRQVLTERLGSLTLDLTAEAIHQRGRHRDHLRRRRGLLGLGLAAAVILPAGWLAAGGPVPRPEDSTAVMDLPSTSPKPSPTATTATEPQPTASPTAEPTTRVAEPVLGYELSVPAAWVDAEPHGLPKAFAPGVRSYGPVRVSIGTPDGTITLCDSACREVTGATSLSALERHAGEDAGLVQTAWQGSYLDGEPGSEIRVRLTPASRAQVLRRQIAIHNGRPVVIDFDMGDGRLSGELRLRILDSFHFLKAPPAMTGVVAPDGSYEIALTERWMRRPDVGGTMVFGDRGQLLTIAAGDGVGRIPTCIDSVGAWETCATARATSLDELEAAIKPERISEHGTGGPIVVRDVTALGGEPAVAYHVEAYEYPANGAEWVTYVAAMHGGRPYILRVWAGMESGTVSLDELLDGFRFLD